MAATEIARGIIKDVVSKYLRSEKRINEATEELTTSLSHLLTHQPVNKRPKGATVMTESATVRLPDGTYTSKPQNL